MLENVTNLYYNDMLQNTCHTTRFRSALRLALFMENPARPFLFVVRFNSSLLGQLLPSKRYTALFVKDTIADFDHYICETKSKQTVKNINFVA